ncbi:lectin BRA-2-like [Saccostrea cucullata]|uniref:lectin BRA-2-like n=1 Tax=Saccostrea cuccullata TaxID=36930 RepID=UPI002ED260C3
MGEETARHDYREEEKQPRDLARSVTLCIFLKKISYTLLVIALILGLVALTTLFILEKNKVEDQQHSLQHQLNFQEKEKKWTEQQLSLRLQVSNLQEKYDNISEENQVLKEELSGLQEKLGNLTGCPDYWFPLENNCYLFSNATATFSEAQHVCARDSAYILEDLSPEEKSFTKSRVFTFMWIGVTDNLKEGVYVYESTGSRVTNGDWVKGQPQGGRNENCAVALKDSNWQWHDYPCSHKFDYVCKKSKEGLV